MIDAPGPWGTGPFTLTEGCSSLEVEIALVQADPFACVWLPTGQPRSERVVLEANPDHWNIERGPRLERVVFRNDLPPAQALELVCTTEGEVDVVTEVAPPTHVGSATLNMPSWSGSMRCGCWLG